MSTDKHETREIAKPVADPNKWLGIPIVIWLALITAVSGSGVVSGFIGNYIGHENGKNVGRQEGIIDGIKEGKATPPANQIGLNQARGKITTPTNRQTIEIKSKDDEFECKGTVEGLAPGLHLWLAIERNGWIWPKKGEGDITVDPAGNWHARIADAGDVNEPFTVTLFVVNDEAQQVIRDWFAKSEETKTYAGLESTRGMSHLSRIDQLRTNVKK